MPVEQAEATEMEEIRCSGAPTLEQYHEVQMLTGSRRIGILYDSLLVGLALSTGLSTLLTYESSPPFVFISSSTSFVLSFFLLAWRLKWMYYNRKHRNRFSAQKRGWFTEGHFTIDQNGISYRSDSEYGKSDGFIPWSRFSSSKTSDSLIVLFYDDLPSNENTVFFKNWFASDADWQRFLDLAERSIGPHEMVEM